MSSVPDLCEMRPAEKLDNQSDTVRPPINKTNHSACYLEGGSGMEEIDQTVWLLPYWMGRWHKLIE